jgi:hypothetical protein
MEGLRDAHMSAHDAPASELRAKKSVDVSRRCASELRAASTSGNAAPPRFSRRCAIELRDVLPCHPALRLVFTCLRVLDYGGRRRDPPHGARVADASPAGIEGRTQPVHGNGRIGQGLGGRHGRKGPWTRKYHSTSGGGGRRLWLQIDGVAAVCGGAVAGQSNPSFARESFPGTGTEAVCN